MGNTISPDGRAAEARLSILHETVRSNKTEPLEIPYFLRRDLETGERVAPYSPLPLARKTFHDIGMESIDELIETFKQYDAAIARKDNREILRCFMRLLGDKNPNTELKGGE